MIIIITSRKVTSKATFVELSISFFFQVSVLKAVDEEHVVGTKNMTN